MGDVADDPLTLLTQARPRTTDPRVGTIVRNEGRAKLVDFGLARWSTIDEPRGGTRGYIVPEVAAGQPPSPQSDSYSFSVCVHQALAPGQDALAIRPRELGRAIAGGLRSDPETRTPLAVIAAALARAAELRFPRARQLALATIAVVAIPLLMHSDDPPCVQDPSLREIWDVARTQADYAFAATGVNLAAETFERVDARLHAYADRWDDARAEQCIAGATDPRHRADPRSQCLDRQRAAFVAWTQLLGDADAKIVRSAAEGTARLEAVEECDNPGNLHRDPQPAGDQVVAAGVAELREQMAGVGPLVVAGRLDEAVALANSIADAATELGFAPVVAEAQMHVARLQERAGKIDTAAQIAEEAYLSSIGTGHDRVAANAALLLFQFAAQRDPHHPDVARWEGNARAAVDRMGNDGRLRARLLNALAIAASERSEPAAALALFEETTALWRALEGERSMNYALALMGLGVARRNTGEAAGGLAELERAYEIQRDILGPSHPHLAIPLTNLGGTAVVLARYEDGREYLRRALALNESAFGRDHPRNATILRNLAFIAIDLDDHAEFLEVAQRMVSILDRAENPDRLGLSNALRLLGQAQENNGDHASARATLTRALDEQTALYGDRPDREVAVTVNSLGSLHAAAQEWALAREHFDKAIAINRSVLRPDDPEHAPALHNLGVLYERSGDLHKARDYLTEAFELRNRGLVPLHPDIESSMRSLGRVLAKLRRWDECLAVMAEAPKFVESGRVTDPIAIAEINATVAQCGRGMDEDGTVR